MKTLKKRSVKSTQISPFFCVCGCKRLVLRIGITEELDGPIAIAVCYKCGIELEHASDLNSLRHKLKDL